MSAPTAAARGGRRAVAKRARRPPGAAGRTRRVRPGRKVQLVASSLWSAGHEVARMTAVRIRTGQVDVPVADDRPPREPPDGLERWEGGWRDGGAYHLLGVDIRSAVPASTRP